METARKSNTMNEKAVGAKETIPRVSWSEKKLFLTWQIPLN
jgi:hypothetical protein